MAAKKRDKLVEDLEGPHRLARQKAAQALLDIAKKTPSDLIDIVDDLIDALDRPEPQTRIRVLETLTLVIHDNPKPIAKKLSDAVDAMQLSLFEETSSLVRLAAFKLLIEVASISPAMSLKFWPLIDEAIMCFHGSPEYVDMLKCMGEFSQKKIDNTIYDILKKRLEYDVSKSPNKAVRALSKEIVENLKVKEAKKSKKK